MHADFLFALVSPLFAGIATVLAGGAAKLLHPFIIVSFGPLIGVAILIPLLFLRGERFTKVEIKENSKDLILLISVRQVVGWLLFVIGLTLTDAIKALFLTKVEPYFVLFWHWLLRKEKVKRRHLALLAVHITGAVLLSTGGESGSFGKAQLGDLFIVGSMATSALSYVWAASLTKKLGALKTNSFMLLCGGLFFLPFALLASPKSGWTNGTGWVYLVGYAVLFCAISLTFWFASLRTVKGWMVSALRALGPLVGAPFAYFLLGETLTPLQLTGGLIVLATSFLIAREHFKGETHSG